MSLQINQLVLVKDEPGIVRFIGETEFAPGIWIGIELHKGVGKNDGSVSGIRYFDCEKTGTYGIFVRKGMVKEETQAPQASDSTLHKIIDKLQSKLRYATEDIKQFKEHAKILQDTLTEAESKMEMIDVDKHFLLASKAELQQKLTDLQLKYDELSTDYQLILEESELNKQIELEIETQFSHTQYSESDIQAILLRNKKLEIALVNLQKFTNDSELSLKKEIEFLNAKVAENKSAMDGFAEVSKKLLAAEAAIESLQSQLESTLDLERIIEHLHSENNELVNEVEKLKRVVEELTELHELDKSLEESQSLVEADLKRNLQSLQDVIRKDKTSIEELLKKNRYMESKLKGLTMDEKAPKVEAESKLESLQLQLRKYKSSSHVNSIDSMLLQGKIDLLQQRLALERNQTHLTTQLEIVFLLKLVISNSTLMTNEFQLSTQYDNRLLTDYLNCLLVLWEHNYDTAHFKSISEPFYNLVSNLDSTYNCMIDLVKEFNSIDTSFVERFIIDSTKLVLLTNGLVLQDRCYFLFFVRWVYQTCQSSSMLINEIRIKLTNNDKSLELFANLSQECMEIELNTTVLKLSENHDIRFEERLDIPKLVLEISHPVKLLKEILHKIDSGDNNQDDDLTQLTDEISDYFKRFHLLVTLEYETMPITIKTIYEEAQKCESTETTEEPKEDSNKFAELSARLLEKDRQLDDFQLNIQMLEDNMKSFNVMHSDLMNQIKRELDETKLQHELVKKNFQQVLEDKEAIESQVQDLLKTNKIFADGDLLGKFDDLKSENQFTERLALIEEIFILKRLALHNFGTNTNYSSYKWLESLPIKSQVSLKSLKFRQCSESLRRLALDTKAIRLNPKPEWKPKASLPKYIQLTLYEQANNYETARDSLLHDISI